MRCWIVVPIALLGATSCVRYLSPSGRDGGVRGDQSSVEGGAVRDSLSDRSGGGDGSERGDRGPARDSRGSDAPRDGAASDGARLCLTIATVPAPSPTTTCGGAFPVLVGGEFACSGGGVRELWPATTLAYSCSGPSGGTAALRCADRAVRRVEVTAPTAQRELSASCGGNGEEVVGGGCRCAAGTLTASAPIPFNGWICACSQVGLHQAVAFCHQPSLQCMSRYGLGGPANPGSSERTTRCLGSAERLVVAGCRLQNEQDPSVPYAGAVVLQRAQSAGANDWTCAASAPAEAGSQLRTILVCGPPR